MASPRASVGNWYRLEGELLEVVALDEDDATIELQYFDGTVEEMDFEEWEAHCNGRAVEQVDTPEDWSGSVDVEPDDERPSDRRNTEADLQARSLDGLDLFEAR